MTVSFAWLQLLDPDMTEHNHAGRVVELEADRPRLRSGGIAFVLRNHGFIQFHGNHIVAGFDVEAIPVILDLVSRFGRIEQIDATRGVLVGVAVENLDLVADVGWCAIGVPSSLPTAYCARDVSRIETPLLPPRRVHHSRCRSNSP